MIEPVDTERAPVTTESNADTVDRRRRDALAAAAKLGLGAGALGVLLRPRDAAAQFCLDGSNDPECGAASTV